ncbi:hypothetical protein D3C85_1562250 [compost metagenome]
MLNYDELDEFFVKHPFLQDLKQDNTITSTIVLYYILSGKLLNHLVDEANSERQLNS